jgi:hypothetical protein
MSSRTLGSRFQTTRIIVVKGMDLNNRISSHDVMINKTQCKRTVVIVIKGVDPYLEKHCITDR